MTQTVLYLKTRNDAKKALLEALTAELRVMREDFDTHVKSIRSSLPNERPLPRPDDFSASTVVFDANAGSLGQLGDPDLVDHLVETYSSVHGLRDDANRFRGVPIDRMPRDMVEHHHFQATSTQLLVMKLHNRLAIGELAGSHNIYDTEQETRALTATWQEEANRDPRVIDFTYPRITPGTASAG